MNFNTFQNNKILNNAKQAGWKLYTLTDLLIDDSRNSLKIKKRDYIEEGSTPIIDQGKELIGGYSNIEDGFYTGKSYIVFGDHTRILKYIDFPAFIGADGVKILKNINEKITITKYLYYFLSTVSIPETGYNRHFKFLKEVVIPVPKIDVQIKIVNLLDKINSIKNKRQQQIEALSALKQSVFLDMFGDPYLNINKYPFIDLAQVKLDISNGLYLKKDEYNEKGDTFVTWISDFIKTGEVNFEKSKRANVDEQRYKKYKLSYGDILFVRSSLTEEGIGKCGFVPREGYDRLIFEDHIIKITLNDDVLPEYFQAYSETEYFRNQVSRVSNTSTMTTINQKSLLGCRLILPPLNKQQEYIEKLENVKRNIFTLRKSIKQYDYLYNSILHKAFNGELY